MCTLPLYFEPATELPNWLVVVLFSVPFVGGLIYYAYKTRHAKSWRKGVFPQSLKPTEDNFLEAYLALGAKLILFNYQESKNKTKYINAYFNRYFKFSNYNFGDSLLFSLNYPIQFTTITNWMKLHLPNEGQRSQVIYFLCGLCMVSGKMSDREYQLLFKITLELELPESALEQIIAIHLSYKQEQFSSNSKQKTKSAINFAFQILGVEKNASPEIIKKAYRKLVKLHHPDNFATGSPSEQKMAAEKFIEIQHAYESLLKSN